MDSREKWAYRQGSLEEARLIREGMTKESEGLYDVVLTCAQQGRPRDSIVETVSTIYGPGLPFRRRLRVAWKIVRGYRR